MSPQTKEALLKSIKHWEEMAENGWKNEQPEAVGCALCNMFLKAFNCDGCPVKEHTRERHCGNTPYWKAHEQFQRNVHYDKYLRASMDNLFKVYAKQEVEFLKSLLEE